MRACVRACVRVCVCVRETEREKERENTNILFDKDCSLGSVKNLTNSPC